MAIFEDVANDTGMNSLRMARSNTRRLRSGSYGSRYGASRPASRPSLQPQEINQATRRFQSGALGNQYGANQQSYVSPIIEEEQTYNAEDIQNVGEPLTEYQDVPLDKNAIPDFAWGLLAPNVRDALQASGTRITVGHYGQAPGYYFYNNNINLVPGMSPSDIRHELLHAVLTQRPDLVPKTPWWSRASHNPIIQGASGLIGPKGLAGELSPYSGLKYSLLGTNAFITRLQESAAISVGGAHAYPGLRPAFDPSAVDNVFGRITNRNYRLGPIIKPNRHTNYGVGSPIY